MSLITSTRNQQANLINQNKASIIITRTAKVSDGAGGWTILDPEILDSQDVRIYNKRTRILNIETGGYSSSRITKMIAKYNADIKRKTSTNTDKFTYGDKTYEVEDVKNVYTKGNIVFKEYELVEL